MFISPQLPLLSTAINGADYGMILRVGMVRMNYMLQCYAIAGT
jgi:hypothetical protein